MVFPLDFPHHGKAPRSVCACLAPLLFFLGTLSPEISGAAAVHYVRAGAAGDGSGSDWGNAYPALPATLTRGDTYYVAPGSYPGYTFDEPARGAAPIIVKKATAWDHGSAPGWNGAWAGGVALWGPILITTPYITFDGVTGCGRHNHGFEVYRDGDGPLIELDNATHDINLSHIHLHFSSRNQVSRYDAFYGDSPCSNITISDCFIHDIPGCPLLMRYWTGLLFERNWVVRNRSTPTDHAEGVSTHGGGNFIFRDNLWQDIEGTAAIVNLYDTTRNWQIYGNIFAQTDPSQSHGFGHGVVSDNFDGSDIIGLQFYNNTISGICNGASALQFWSSGTRDVWACNNIWFNCSDCAFTGLTYDYNTFSACTFAFNYVPPPHDLLTTGDPFVNTPALNFVLKRPTAPGLILPPSVTPSTVMIAPEGVVDPVGAVRQADGVWDRGAFEYVDPVSTPTSIKMPNQVGYWNFDEGMGIMARDLSGNDNHGILAGALWTAAGRKGGGLLLRNANAHVVVPGDASLGLATNRFTLTCWVCPSGPAPPAGTLVQRVDDDGTGYAWKLCARKPGAPLARGPYFCIHWSGGTGSGAYGQLEGNQPLVPNVWQFLTVTYDGAALRLYVNGVFNMKTVKSGGVVPASTRPLWIGASGLASGLASDPFLGRIDEVRIYNRALSQGEILGLMRR